VLSNVRSHQSAENKDRELTSCPTDRLRGLASSSLPSRTVQSPLATPIATGHHRRSSMFVHNRYSDILSPVAEGLYATLSLKVEALQGKMCQNSLPSGVGRSLGAKISGGRGRFWGIFFGFYKTRHILQTAPCYVPSIWHNTGVWLTDAQTDELLWLIQRLQCEHCARCKNVLQNGYWNVHNNGPLYSNLTAGSLAVGNGMFIA